MYSTKKAWAIPIKNKTKFSVASAFENCFEEFLSFQTPDRQRQRI